MEKIVDTYVIMMVRIDNIITSLVHNSRSCQYCYCHITTNSYVCMCSTRSVYIDICIYAAFCWLRIFGVYNAYWAPQAMTKGPSKILIKYVP